MLYFCKEFSPLLKSGSINACLTPVGLVLKNKWFLHGEMEAVFHALDWLLTSEKTEKDERISSGSMKSFHFEELTSNSLIFNPMVNKDKLSGMTMNLLGN
ncbi:hypothetical protein LFYK43_21760 [Ligilactobacillus salitolerans]|uniref:Uncharacterized protein n=1 Tax=Ligilactobacillus salitolerans TaxID=1808352 RepID=A0A401IW48_9LACO|nr:hypothetical protein LFYK43_21760 [Ligilactobacillus salitolerans]